MKAADRAASGGDYVVTLGIPPLRPETGYGYILKGDLYGEIDGLPVHRTVRFTEKPSLERAAQYVKSGNYFWNSGIFIWRVDLIRRLIENHIPELGCSKDRAQDIKKLICRLQMEGYEDSI